MKTFKEAQHLFTFVTLLVFVVALEGNLQCRDESNNPVDWFVAYKLPRLKGSSNPLIKTGKAYLYMTSNTVSKGWILSTKSINDSASLPGYTLQPLYVSSKIDESDTAWLLYNDETPNKTVTFELGHTKGVVMSKANGGFWLVHSVPRYPPVPTGAGHYSYPASGTHFGQSFLCVSLATDQLDVVGLQLMYNEPQIYSSNIPAALEQSLPHLVAAIKRTKISTAPWYHQVQLTSLAGMKFQTFAKTSKFGKELYADWVAQVLKVNLLVETWRNGPGRLPSECTLPYKVNDVKSIVLSSADARFKTAVDHSKWGVATNESQPWVCVGDINRMSTQAKRGGGTVCMSHDLLWTAYRRAVANITPCNKTSVPLIKTFYKIIRFQYWPPVWSNVDNRNICAIYYNCVLFVLFLFCI